MINIFYFVLAFSIGMFIVYITTPPPQIVLKFPSPYNAGKVIYADKANNCYTYEVSDVSCPKDKELIKPQPILEDFRGKRISPRRAKR
jgi:hypothetical protein